ncbi:hypothetical protein GC169_05280 [bacterium]|nr:hypothetical protein [bacterium]
MTAYEALARRYCALLGEDPDGRVEGLPVWKIALADLEAAMNALDTFGFEVRSAFHEIAEASAAATRRGTVETLPNDADSVPQDDAALKRRAQIRLVA